MGEVTAGMTDRELADRFFKEIGIGEQEFANALIDSKISDGWIAAYRTYQATQSADAVGLLHRKVDALFALLTDDGGGQGGLIADSQSVDAGVWLVIAGALVEGIRRRADEVARQQRVARFRTNPPSGWIPQESGNRETLSEIGRFARDVTTQWGRFWASYEREPHVGVRADGSTVVETLEWFGRTPSPPQALFWPQSRDAFASDLSINHLYGVWIMEVKHFPGEIRPIWHRFGQPAGVSEGLEPIDTLCVRDPRFALISRLPEIVARQDWPVLSRLLRIWISRDERQFVWHESNGRPVVLVDADWYLGIPCGRNNVAELARAAIIVTDRPPLTEPSVAREATAIWHGLEAGKRVSLSVIDPPPADPLARGPLYLGHLTDEVPASLEMFATLGRHELRAYATGLLERVARGLFVRQATLWWRVADQFDFEEDGRSELGTWSEAGFHPIEAAQNIVGVRVPGISVRGIHLRNADFRAFRERGCGGRDFLVRSRLKKLAEVGGVFVPI